MSNVVERQKSKSFILESCRYNGNIGKEYTNLLTEMLKERKECLEDSTQFFFSVGVVGMTFI